MTPEIILTDQEWPYTKAKTAVLSAAAAVIRQDGARAATLKNIAAKAGITEPAIFRHFDGVDGLFEGLFSVVERICSCYDDAYRNAEGKGMARLRSALTAVVECLAASGDFAYLVLHAREVFREYSALKDKAAESDIRHYKSALACVEEGVKSGDIRSDINPALIVAALTGSLSAIVSQWLESGFAFDLRQIWQERWDDIERLAASTKAAARLKGSKESAAAKARFAAIFTLKPARSTKAAKAGKAVAAKKSSAAAKKTKPAGRTSASKKKK
jgi:TetR/AcrR family acrAB operon transcriptional repressor